MALVGPFDPQVAPIAWFDPQAQAEGWFDPDLITVSTGTTFNPALVAINTFVGYGHAS
jgi:hypothetical protein